MALVAQREVLAQNVVEDGGVGLSYPELEYIVEQWTPQMQKSAAEDVGDRLELLNVALTNKKIAEQADKLSLENDPQVYWEYVFMIRGAKRKFIIDQFVKNIEVPDMTALAKERYETQKEEYALVPERRMSSHILFACAPGMCSRVEAKAKAQKVLDQLLAGADFAEMVQQYSDDPGTRAKGGKFDKWVSLGEPGVTPPYSGGLFEIAEIGQYSGLVSSQFGIHIIRLDGIEEAHFKPYAEVKDKIMSDLETEYRKLAVKDWLATFQISDKAYIDGAAMEKIFSKYGAEEKAIDVSPQ
jgi:parvulin-like peptidyl-prolyl isomerase